jgi:hypothetical protein
MHRIQSELLLNALDRLRLDVYNGFPVSSLHQSCLSHTTNVSSCQEDRFSQRVPVMQQRTVVDSLDWLVPLGMAHLQTLWDDEHTDPKILQSIEESIAAVSIVSESATNSFNPTPSQLLTVLDSVRMAREHIAKETFFKTIEEYFKSMEVENEQKLKQEQQELLLQKTAARRY